jgi:hypothetical protein
MTAPIGVPANIYTGTREFSQVTNTYGGYLISGGAAYNLQTPWQADKLEIYNYTTGAEYLWFRDMAAGTALQPGTTPVGTNGVTEANVLGGFANQQQTITGMSTATPTVVTVDGHGLISGQRVVITKLTGNIGQIFNYNTYVVNVLTANTFSLYDIYGFPVANIATYSSSGGQITLSDPVAGIVDSPTLYYLTLGTGVIGSSTNLVYFQATKMNYYVNLQTV